MRTIEEGIRHCIRCLKYLSNYPPYEPVSVEYGFIQGVAFAEEWISIEDEPLPKGETILLMYDNNPKHVVSGFADMEDRSPCPHWRGDGWIKATSWRPINRK